jgi:hypothetical protein
VISEEGFLPETRLTLEMGDCLIFGLFLAFKTAEFALIDHDDRLRFIKDSSNQETSYGSWNYLAFAIFASANN